MDSGIGAQGLGSTGHSGSPGPGSPDQAQAAGLWDQVADRVADYLRALGIRDPLHLDRLAARIRPRVEARAASTPLEDPVEAAIEEAYGLLDEWLNLELGIEGDRDALFAARAAVLSGAVPNWAARFAGVSGESLAAAIHGASALAVPEAAPLSMEPNTIELFWYRLGRGLAGTLRRLLGYLPAEGPTTDPDPARPGLGHSHQAQRS